MERLKEATSALQGELGIADYAIITGTGIVVTPGESIKKLPYSSIPNMPLPTSPSHEGYFEKRTLGNKAILIAHGRFHYYEGYSGEEVAFLPRLMALSGVKLVILTNAAGGLNPLLKKGDLMLIKDHINLSGRNPLVGKNIDELGERFPDMSSPYSGRYMKIIKEVALKEGIDLKEGVYVSVLGPSLETPAETRMLRLLGADAVGMSTVPEVIALKHASTECIAISIITNINRPDCMEKIPIEDVIKTASDSSSTLTKLLESFLEVL